MHNPQSVANLLTTIKQLRGQLTRALDREAALKKQIGDEREAHVAQVERLHAEHRDESVKFVASQRAMMAGLDQAAENRFIKRVVAAKPKTAADVYKVIGDKLAEHRAESEAPAAPDAGAPDARKMTPAQYEAHLRARGLADPSVGSTTTNVRQAAAPAAPATVRQMTPEQFGAHLRKRGLQDPNAFGAAG